MLEDQRFADREWAFVVGFALLMGFLVIVPVMAGYLSSTADHRFQGFSFVEDSHAYAAYVNSGVNGNLLFLNNASTPDPGEGRYIILYFSFLAAVVRLTGLPLDVVWNIFHFLSVVALFIIMWFFLGKIFADKKVKAVAFILAGLGGGIGGFIYIGSFLVPWLKNLYSTDLTYQYGYSFIGFSFHALAVFGFIFILLAVIDLFKYYERKKIRYLGWVFLFLLIALFNHPPGGVIAVVALGLFAATQAFHQFRATKKWDFKPLLSIFAVGVIFIIYLWWARQDPVYAFHQAIYLTWDRKENPLFYLIGFGFLLLFAALGFQWRNGFKDARAPALLASWVAVAIVASNVLPAGIKYLYLIHFPLALLAGAGIVRAVEEREWVPLRWQKSALALLVIIVCFSAFFVIAKRTDEVLQQPKHYLLEAENHALNFLSGESPGIVLSDTRMGSNISWRTPSRPFLAHGFLTIDYSDHQQQVNEFFAGSVLTTEQKMKFLRENSIIFVYVGADESALGVIDSGLGLQEVFAEGGVRIYRVPSVAASPLTPVGASIK